MSAARCCAGRACITRISSTGVRPAIRARCGRSPVSQPEQEETLHEQDTLDEAALCTAAIARNATTVALTAVSSMARRRSCLATFCGSPPAPMIPATVVIAIR